MNKMIILYKLKIRRDYMNLKKELQKYLQLPDDEFLSTLYMLREKGFLKEDNSLQGIIRMLQVSFGNGHKQAYKEMKEKILASDEENGYENHNK